MPASYSHHYSLTYWAGIVPDVGLSFPYHLCLGAVQILVDTQTTSFWSTTERMGLEDKCFLKTKKNHYSTIFLHPPHSMRKLSNLCKIHLDFQHFSKMLNLQDRASLCHIRNYGKDGDTKCSLPEWQTGCRRCRHEWG